MEELNLYTSIIFPYLNFGLFAFALYFFFRNPLRDMAKNRRIKFDNHVEVAKKIRNEAEARLAEVSKRVTELDAEIGSMKQRALNAAKGECDRIIQNAENLARNITAEAGRTAVAEFEKARRELRQEMTHEAVQRVIAGLPKELSSEKQKELIKRGIQQLEGLH